MRSRHPHHGARRSGGRGDVEMRQRLSVEAARIMAEEGVTDFHAAKRKAADRLGVTERAHLPSNQEIDVALREHLALFHARDLPATLARLRRLAVNAMHLLAAFEPRLVGAVLSGTVTPETAIQLHVSADTPELVALKLHEQGIPYEEFERRLRYGGDRQLAVPGYRFLADTVPVEIVVFSHAAAREAPLSPVDGRPMGRAGIREVEGLAGGLSGG